jgi:hypothetical protein
MGVDKILNVLSQEYGVNNFVARKYLERIVSQCSMMDDKYIVDQLSFVQTVACNYKNMELIALEVLTDIYEKGDRNHDRIAKRVDARLNDKMLSDEVNFSDWIDKVFCNSHRI